MAKLKSLTRYTTLFCVRRLFSTNAFSYISNEGKRKSHLNHFCQYQHLLFCPIDSHGFHFYIQIKFSFEINLNQPHLFLQTQKMITFVLCIVIQIVCMCALFGWVIIIIFVFGSIYSISCFYTNNIRVIITNIATAISPEVQRSRLKGFRPFLATEKNAVHENKNHL